MIQNYYYMMGGCNPADGELIKLFKLAIYHFKLQLLLIQIPVAKLP